MNQYDFDQTGRFVIGGYDLAKPFASFLPGIAGPTGIPLWVFYVNRGQAIASFGIEDKDNPIMEFFPANAAYQNTPYIGFRTFLKLSREAENYFYEPFSPWRTTDSNVMAIGMNEMELQSTSAEHGIQTNVLYFTLPGENLAGLARRVTVTNVGDTPVALEALDGMARVMPYGVNNLGLKELGRTIEAWMEVFDLERGIPFYRLRASFVDTTAVEELRAGHFYLAFTERDGQPQLLPAFVDPRVVFGPNTALSTPNRFMEQPLAQLQAERQITTGKTPCGFFGAAATLQPGQALTIYAIVGHAGDAELVHRRRETIARAAYLRQKRDEANRLVAELTDVIETHTSSPTFDAYCRQTLLDNVLRGGWPLILGSDERPSVYHIYSRKHGDLERDYNAFYVAAEMYSQGNGNYRDVNQNRRCDVLLNPRVGDFNVLAFLSLIQADGYNPLVVNGSRFTLPPQQRAPVLALVKRPDKLEPLLARPFTPGQLLKAIDNLQIELTVAPEVFIAAALAHAEQHFEATFGEGYWIDHWFYNLDLIDTYLAVYPDQKDALLFERTVPYFDSPAVVQPRARKHVLVGDQVRQHNALVEDEEKAALIAARTEAPNLMRTAHGQGEVYRATVFAKLVGLALIKLATLDPLGMGIEMEAGRPGWCDALNGLPALFGSSLSETLELARLLRFLADVTRENEERRVELPVEQHTLLQDVQQALSASARSTNPVYDHQCWDALATARESYRQRTRLGFAGQTVSILCTDLVPFFASALGVVQGGIRRATKMSAAAIASNGGNGGIPPTYFSYTAADYAVLTDGVITDNKGNPQCDPQGHPYVRVKRFAPRVLPLYLEGPVHALKAQPGAERARELYQRVKESELFDRQLHMYKVNAPLENESHEIGRARAFTPGWLENESIWLHMEYKYLLEVLKAGLYDAFFDDFTHVLIPFQDPAVYGRSPLENSSFIVSSAHPDESLHGAGFVARLSGSTAEFLHMWSVMMAGKQPFFVQDGELHLALKPALPSWLFDENGALSFTFLGTCPVTYHNPDRRDTFKEDVRPYKIVLHTRDGAPVEIAGGLTSGVIGPPYAALVREGQIQSIEVFY